MGGKRERRSASPKFFRYKTLFTMNKNETQHGQAAVACAGCGPGGVGREAVGPGDATQLAAGKTLWPPPLLPASPPRDSTKMPRDSEVAEPPKIHAPSTYCVPSISYFISFTTSRQRSKTIVPTLQERRGT